MLHAGHTADPEKWRKPPVICQKLLEGELFSPLIEKKNIVPARLNDTEILRFE